MNDGNAKINNVPERLSGYLHYITYRINQSERHETMSYHFVSVLSPES